MSAMNPRPSTGHASVTDGNRCEAVVRASRWEEVVAASVETERKSALGQKQTSHRARHDVNPPSETLACASLLLQYQDAREPSLLRVAAAL